MCGTPVVSFAVGGVPEIAARTVGMELVAPGDVAAMSERVEHLDQAQRHRIAVVPSAHPRKRGAPVLAGRPHRSAREPIRRARRSAIASRMS